LLVRSDRPLLTDKTLQALLYGHQAKTGPLAPLDPAAIGVVPAACADAHWLVGQLAQAASAVTLDDLVSASGATPVAVPDPTECLAVDSLTSLADAERILRQRINLRWMQAGVQLTDPATTYIHAAVTIGRGTCILPNTHLWGNTTVGDFCQIGPNSILRDAQIGCQCSVLASVVEGAIMEDGSDIGPFSHLRKGARLCQGAHMGNFGEMKNSTLGPNSKMGHLGYLGDATVGANVNIGAGTITCNYDGEKKHPTIIEDGAFIGSDTMLVAPVHIGANAQIGAGSVVTRDVPAGAVAYGVPARIMRKASGVTDRGFGS
jgi:bifunctional UDP-N-acetylglucosamine pyrophosphorylase/glucosamine-1-phosphate N-acetyltransferase